jgi:hypothetical protein
MGKFCTTLDRYEVATRGSTDAKAVNLGTVGITNFPVYGVQQPEKIIVMFLPREGSVGVGVNFLIVSSI